MRRSRSKAVWFCAAALLLAGCGDGGDGGGGAARDDVSSGSEGETNRDGEGKSAESEFDACALLDQKSVEAAIGESVERSEGTATADGAASCSWYGVDTGSLQQKGVTLLVARDNGKERWTAHKELVSGARPEPDFGDEAFTDGQIIAGYRGDVYVVISPLYNDAGVTLAQVKPLGQQVLERFGGA